ncbi:MAG TPA: DUF3828 domain-containing protein [Caulobacteraceae bacterium]|jgi:hypothetical protein
MFARPFKSALVLGSALLALASPAALAAPSDSASAKAFVQKLYDKHVRSDASVYDTGLIALIRKDRRLAHGEVGALDFDPICQCQDAGGMKVEVLDANASARTAVVQVRLTFTEAQPPEVIPVEFDLVRTGAGWRVHDIKSKETPSLRDYMQKHAGGK